MPFTAWVWPVSTRCGTRSAVFHAARRGPPPAVAHKRAVCVHRDGVRSVVVSDEVAEDLAVAGFTGERSSRPCHGDHRGVRVDRHGGDREVQADVDAAQLGACGAPVVWPLSGSGSSTMSPAGPAGRRRPPRPTNGRRHEPGDLRHAGDAVLDHLCARVVGVVSHPPCGAGVGIDVERRLLCLGRRLGRDQQRTRSRSAPARVNVRGRPPRAIPRPRRG